MLRLDQQAKRQTKEELDGCRPWGLMEVAGKAKKKLALFVTWSASHSQLVDSL